MSTELLLFLLRWLAGLTLLAFVALVLLTIRRDMDLTGEQVAARQRRHGQLVVTAVEGLPLKVGTSYPLLPVTTFGRAPANTVHIQDSFASNHHALLTLRTGRWWLEDRGSRNGTRVNGQPLEGSVVVSTGDIIGVGRVELKVELE